MQISGNKKKLKLNEAKKKRTAVKHIVTSVFNNSCDICDQIEIISTWCLAICHHQQLKTVVQCQSEYIVLNIKTCSDWFQYECLAVRMRRIFVCLQSQNCSQFWMFKIEHPKIINLILHLEKMQLNDKMQQHWKNIFIRRSF